MVTQVASEKENGRKAWTVAAGALLCMIAASVPLSGLSFFHPYLFAVMGADGASQPQILLYITLLMLSIVASMMFIGGPLLPKVGARTLMLGGSVVVAGALLLFGIASNPIMLYAAGILLGLGYGSSYQLVPMVWVNNWFVAKKGLVVGIVTGGTGIGGVLWSIVVPGLGGTPAPGNESYRTAYFVMAGVVLALTIPAAAFLATPERPSMAGLVPLGAGARSTTGIPTPHEAAKPVPGFTFHQAMRSPWLWLLFGCTMLIGVVHASAQILPPYLTSRVTSAPPDGLGKALGFFSLLMSIWTIGLIVLKPVLGILNDKLGILKAMAIAFAMQSVFFVFLPSFASFGVVVPMAAMLLMSAGMSTGTVEPPLLTATAMGPRDFGRIWSISGSAYTLGMAVGAPVWGLFYEPATKSYTTGFYLAPVVLLIVLIGAAVGVNAGKRTYTAQHERDLAEWEASRSVTEQPA